jgi:hypothetical protein
MKRFDSLTQRLSSPWVLGGLGILLLLVILSASWAWRTAARTAHANALQLGEQWRALNVGSKPQSDKPSGPNPGDPAAARLAYYLEQGGLRAELESLDHQLGATIIDLDADAAVDLVSRLQDGFGPSLQQVELLMDQGSGRWSVFVLVGDTR